MNKAQLDLLKYLWVGFRLDGQTVYAPNGKVVQRVLDRTVTECAFHGWIALDVDKARYTLTDAGRQRVLVKERVRDFCRKLADESAQHPT